jgi:SAM-dependent methyltransferase
VTRLYRHPDEYDLEHLGDEEDINFYLGLVKRLRPKRILELGCGTGRIALPLAEQGIACGYRVVGLENEAAMLGGAVERRRSASPQVQECLTFVEEDMRSWQADERFDLILAPCSSIAHLHGLDDQIRTWRQARANLCAGGRFVVEVTMPNLAVFADSFSRSPRALVEIDIDNFDEAEGIRLLRHKTTRYLSNQQRAQIRFLYEKYRDDRLVDSYIDDFESHVFFPRELELLFIHADFKLENTIGDYQSRPLSVNSRLIIMTGRRD